MSINDLLALLGPKMDMMKLGILVAVFIAIIVLLKVVFGKKKASRQSLYTSDVTNDAYKTRATSRKGEAETYTVQTQDFDDSKILKPKDLNDIFKKKKKQNSTLNAKELDQLQKELLADFEMAHNVNELIEEAISFDSFGQKNKALESLKQAFELEQDDKEKTRLHMLYKSYRDQKDTLDNLVKKYPSFNKKKEEVDIFNMEDDEEEVKPAKKSAGKSSIQIEHNNNDLSLTKKEKKKNTTTFSLNESSSEATVKENIQLTPQKDIEKKSASGYNFDIEEDEIPVFAKKSSLSLENDAPVSKKSKDLDFEDTITEQHEPSSFDGLSSQMTTTQNPSLDSLVEQELSDEEKEYLNSFTQAVKGEKTPEKSEEDFFNHFMQRVNDTPTLSQDLHTNEMTPSMNQPVEQFNSNTSPLMTHQATLIPSLNAQPAYHMQEENSFISPKVENMPESFDNMTKKSFDMPMLDEEKSMKVKKTNSDIWVNWMSLHGGKVQMKNNIIALDYPWATKKAVKQLETKLQEIVGKDANGNQINFSVVSIHEINDE